MSAGSYRRKKPYKRATKPLYVDTKEQAEIINSFLEQTIFRKKGAGFYYAGAFVAKGNQGKSSLDVKIDTGFLNQFKAWRKRKKLKLSDAVLEAIKLWFKQQEYIEIMTSEKITAFIKENDIKTIESILKPHLQKGLKYKFPKNYENKPSEGLAVPAVIIIENYKDHLTKTELFELAERLEIVVD